MGWGYIKIHYRITTACQYGGRIHFFSLSKSPLKRRICYATSIFLYSDIYRCIGASDRIFDHFIFLNSVPTTPVKR